jgi:hypothetical protein
MRQQGLCILCGRGMDEEDATFEHERSRGGGGAFRDDRIVDDQGHMMNGAAHGRCNSDKGSGA